MPKDKSFVCDASSLIALSESCFIGLLYELRNKHGFEFVIPEMVEYECITRPLGIKEFSMHAIRLKDAVNDGIIQVIRDPKIKHEMERIMELANHLFYARGQPVHLVDRGESAMLAVAREYEYKYLLMDERTTRLLIEDPMSIKKHFEDEFNVHVGVNESALRELARYIENVRVVRTSEFIATGYKVGYFNKYENMEKEALLAALYKLKFTGCSISFDEINEIMASIV